MIHILKRCTIGILAFASVPFVAFALSDMYTHEAVCDDHDDTCYATQLRPFEEKYEFFLNRPTIEKIDNFSSYIDHKIYELYTKEYTPILNAGEDDDSYMITIAGYKAKTASSSTQPAPKKVYFQQMLELPAFDVITGSTTVGYENGRDYFLSHFEDIIETLHESIDLPPGQKKKSLTSLHPAILGYGKETSTSSKRTFKIRNVCTTSECLQSAIQYIAPSQRSTLYILSGEKTPRSEFEKRILNIKAGTFKLSIDTIQAGEEVGFGVEFGDYLTDFSEQYEYKIYYRYEDEEEIEENLHELLHESFSIKKRILSPATSRSPANVEYRVYKPGEKPNPKAPDMCTLDRYERTEEYETSVNKTCLTFQTTLPIEIVHADTKVHQIHVRISESFTSITKMGRVYFYLSLSKTQKDGSLQEIIKPIQDDGDWAPLHPLPTTVIHGKNIGGLARSSVPDFLGHNGFVNKDAQVAVKGVQFLDMFGNPFTNDVGHFFTLTTDKRDPDPEKNTSNIIKMIPFTRTTPSNNITNIQDFDHFEFKFTLTQFGNHPFAGFLITNTSIPTKERQDFSFIPDDLRTVWEHHGGNFHDNLIKLQAAPMTTDEVQVYCGQIVTVTPECISDGMSGCNTEYHSDAAGNPITGPGISASNADRIFKSEDDNKQNEYRYTTVEDNSGLRTIRKYRMNHVDTTPPEIQLTGGIEKAIGGTLNMYATDEMRVQIHERTTPHCELQEPATKVEVTVNGVPKPEYTKTYTGNVRERDAAGNNGIDMAFPLTFLREAGDYTVIIKATDAYGNPSEEVILRFHVEPNPDKIVVERDDSIALPSTHLYADGSNCQQYAFTLRDKFGNLIKNIPVKRLEHACTGGNPTCNTIFADAVSGSGPSAIEFIGASHQTGGDGKLSLCMGSITPGIATPRFVATLQKWNTKGDLISDEITKNLPESTVNATNVDFYKPFIGKLSVWNSATRNWDGKIQTGTSMNYQLELLPKAGTMATSFRTRLDPYKDFIGSIRPNMRLQGISNITGLTEKTSKFSARFNMFIGRDTTRTDEERRAELRDTKPGIHIAKDGESPVIISYPVNGRESRYYLSAKDGPEDRTIIELDEGEVFYGVRIVGSAQGKGEMITTNKDNMGLVTLSDQRTTIRRNALTTIKNMDGKKKNRDNKTIGSINNNVKYVEGNYILPDMYGDAGKYDTLIVKDGNVIIKDDIGTKEKPIGIIVLRDNYDVYRDYKDATGGGNVFVTPNVTKIHAIIYADGAFLSAKSTGEVYERDDSDRTAALSLQLNLTGTLFTRNTIGGGMEGEKGNTLPGGKKVLPTDDNTDLAVIYDLNYTRRGNDGCEKPSGSSECIIPEPFIITHNPIIGTKPPPLFGK